MALQLRGSGTRRHPADAGHRRRRLHLEAGGSRVRRLDGGLYVDVTCKSGGDLEGRSTTPSRRRLPSLSSNPSVGGAPIGLALLGPIQLVTAAGRRTGRRSRFAGPRRAGIAGCSPTAGRASSTAWSTTCGATSRRRNSPSVLQTLVLAPPGLWSRTPIIESSAAGYRLALGRSWIDLLVPRRPFLAGIASPNAPEAALADAETALALCVASLRRTYLRPRPSPAALAHRAEAGVPAGALRGLRARALTALSLADERPPGAPSRTGAGRRCSTRGRSSRR